MDNVSNRNDYAQRHDWICGAKVWRGGLGEAYLFRSFVCLCLNTLTKPYPTHKVGVRL